MKRVKIILLFLMIGFCAKAQFPNNDSVRAYIDKHIRNSAVNAFQNNRLNTALKGIINSVDSVDAKVMGGVRVVDSVWKANDTTLAYRIKGITYQITVAGGDGEIINAGYALLKTGSTLKVDTSLLMLKTDSTTINKDVTIQNTGSLANPLSVKQFVSKKLSELRALTSLDTGTVYKLNVDRIAGDFRYDPSDVSSADDSVMVIVTTGGKRLKRFYTEVWVEWFGAIAGDDIDDSYAWQKAIDFCIRNPLTPKLRALGGRYDVKNLMIAKYIGGQDQFVTITIEGASPALENVSVNGSVTELHTSDKTAFTMAVQAGRMVNIRNILFRGAGPTPANEKETVEWDDDDWTDGSTIRNNRYSPHAGFVVDPTHASVASGDRYPGISAYYTNSTGRGTSHLTFEGCTFKNYIAGIAVSINGYTQNGDNISFNHGVQVANKNFWVSGQTQSRGNIIHDLYSTGTTQTLVNCTEYGLQIGTPPAVTKSNLAGMHKYLYKIQGGFGGIGFDKVYAELVWSLGKSAGMPVDFLTCDIKMAVPNATNTFAAPIIAEGDYVNFVGGSLEWFDNFYSAAFPFNVTKGLSFKNTYIGGNVINNPTGKESRVTFQDVYYRNAEGGNFIWGANKIDRIPLNNVINYAVVPGTTFTSDFWNISYEIKGEKIENRLAEWATLDIDTATLSASFTSSNGGIYKIGDMITLYDQQVDYSNDIYSTGYTSAGWVSDVTGNVVTLSYIPHGLTEGTVYHLYMSRMPRFAGRTVGTVTNGSNIITNAYYASSESFATGQPIKGPGIPVGSRVVSVSGTNITMTLAATASYTDVQLYDAEYKATGTNMDLVPGGGMNDIFSYNNTSWGIGDEIQNVQGGQPAYWKVTKAGLMGSAVAPVFQEVGTDNFSGYTPTAARVRIGSFNFQPMSLNGGAITENIYYDGTNWKRRETGYGSVMYFYNGGMQVYGAGTGSAGSTASLSGLMELAIGAAPKFGTLAGGGSAPIFADNDGLFYKGAFDTTNIANFYQKVRSLFSAGSNITITNGVISATGSGGGSGMSTVEVTGTSQTGATNTKYICTNAGLTTVSLPTTCSQGDEFVVVSYGGTFKISQTGTQQIHFTGASTTMGSTGYITMTANYSAVTLVCVVGSGESDGEWVVKSNQGTINGL